jgi:hypothetical protein
MTLNEFAAARRAEIFSDLQQGLPPRHGSWDEAILREAKLGGPPQMGTTRYTPTTIVFEFIYPRHGAPAGIVSVQLQAPERIVFMPVPAWVVESIWQGDITGSYFWETDAMRLLREFEAQLSPAANADLFGPKLPTRRE